VNVAGRSSDASDVAVPAGQKVVGHAKSDETCRSRQEDQLVSMGRNAGLVHDKKPGVVCI